MALRPPLPLLLALAAACGPYSEVGQKLDVSAVIAGGEAYVAARGTEVRLLLLGPAAPGGAAPFAFTAIDLPFSAGRAAFSTQGAWGEDGGTLTLTEFHEYTLPDERSVGLFSRRGTYRKEVNRTFELGASRSPGRLALSGDDRFAGDYVSLPSALAALGSATARDAACGFQLMNLAVLSSQARIIGFGGPGMTQYSAATDYQGVVAGAVRVRVDGLFSSTTTIAYRGFSDFDGVTIDGTQLTRADSSGDGAMSGTVTFTLAPAAPAPPIAGAVSYGDPGGGGEAIRIANGVAAGGHYLVTLAGGAQASVDPVAAPAPSVADCLGL